MGQVNERECCNTPSMCCEDRSKKKNMRQGNTFQSMMENGGGPLELYEREDHTGGFYTWGERQQQPRDGPQRRGVPSQWSSRAQSKSPDRTKSKSPSYARHSPGRFSYSTSRPSDQAQRAHPTELHGQRPAGVENLTGSPTGIYVTSGHRRLSAGYPMQQPPDQHSQHPVTERVPLHMSDQNGGSPSWGPAAAPQSKGPARELQAPPAHGRRQSTDVPGPMFGAKLRQEVFSPTTSGFSATTSGGSRNSSSPEMKPSKSSRRPMNITIPGPGTPLSSVPADLGPNKPRTLSSSPLAGMRMPSPEVMLLRDGVLPDGALPVTPELRHRRRSTLLSLDGDAPLMPRADSSEYESTEEFVENVKSIVDEAHKSQMRRGSADLALRKQILYGNGLTDGMNRYGERKTES